MAKKTGKKLTNESKTPNAPTPEETPKVEDSKEVAQQALDEIMSQAAEKTGSVLSADEGRYDDAKPEASSYAPVEENQRDFIPGTRRPDLTRLPEFAYDESIGRTRRVSRPKEYHYVWVHGAKMDRMHFQGYRLVMYDGGSRSGLADGGLRGTNMFERTLDNHVRNGDTFLMYVPMRLYAQLVLEDAEQAAKWENAAEQDHHNLGYRYGVRTFQEKDGQQIYN